ncbi:MAG: SUMF1/EgtB/PvdO family nonheme iron enzyme, partial [Nitrospirota bacterium]
RNVATKRGGPVEAGDHGAIRLSWFRFIGMKHMWPFVKIHAVIVFWGFLSWVGMMLGNQSVMAQDLDALKAGVVKITAKTGQVGTGFIVRVEPEVVYIVTAAHVIAGDPQPEVEFFTKRNAPAKGIVLEGAELNDDIRGLALVEVRGKAQIPDGATSLSFRTSAELVSGGEEALVIGHSGGGGNWAVLKRLISNRVGGDISLDPGVASRFSGGPIMVQNKVVGIVMSNRDSFGLGITHKSVLNYLEGFGINPGDKGTSISGSEGIGNFIGQQFTSKPFMSSKIVGKDGPPMVLIQPGSFKMGDWTGGGDKSERPLHEVRLPREFAMGEYEVTFDEYDTFAQATGRELPKDNGWGRGRRPVINVSWEDAKAYAQWLSDQTGKRYRLPTEAEWEFAARSGGKQEIWAGTSEESQLGNYAVYGENSGKKTAEVGSKQPNGLGLYDMSGNVYEWVEDCWHETYKGAPRDGSPWGGDCGPRVIRGGSWYNRPGALRSSLRVRNGPGTRDNLIGIRLAQDIP